MNTIERQRWDEEARALALELGTLIAPRTVSKEQAVLLGSIALEETKLSKARANLERSIAQTMMHEHTSFPRSPREEVFLGWCRNFATRMSQVLVEILNAIQLDMWVRLIEVRSIGQLLPQTTNLATWRMTMQTRFHAIEKIENELGAEISVLERQREKRNDAYARLVTQRENRRALGADFVVVRESERLFIPHLQHAPAGMESLASKPTRVAPVRPGPSKAPKAALCAMRATAPKLDIANSQDLIAAFDAENLRV